MTKFIKIIRMVKRYREAYGVSTFRVEVTDTTFIFIAEHKGYKEIIRLNYK